MPLKSNTKPMPIMVNDGSKDTTPSVTPMRPTPLLGNWCDLPWSADESMNLTATPSKLAPRAWTAAHFVAEVSQFSKPSLVAVSTLSDIQTAPPSSLEVMPIDKSSATEPTALALAEPSSTDESMADLYLTTPADTMLPEDFEDDDLQQEQLANVAATAVPPPNHHATLHSYTDVAPVQPASVEADDSPYDALSLNALPSRASHFVDFRRLKQLEEQEYGGAFVDPQGHHHHQPYQNYYPLSSAQSYSVQASYGPQAPAPQQQVQYGYAPYPRTAAIPLANYQATPQVATVQPVRVGVAPQHAQPRIPVTVEQQLPTDQDLTGRQSRLPVIVLISRFPPPPPPSRVTMETLLRNGSSFESYYQIIMRWYDKVTKALPKAHPTVPPCPPAEHYLHDFDGWVTQIGNWWTQHFTRHARAPKPNKKR